MSEGLGIKCLIHGCNNEATGYDYYAGGHCCFSCGSNAEAGLDPLTGEKKKVVPEMSAEERARRTAKNKRKYESRKRRKAEGRA